MTNINTFVDNLILWFGWVTLGIGALIAGSCAVMLYRAWQDMRHDMYLSRPRVNRKR